MLSIDDVPESAQLGNLISDTQLLHKKFYDQTKLLYYK